MVSPRLLRPLRITFRHTRIKKAPDFSEAMVKILEFGPYPIASRPLSLSEQYDDKDRHKFFMN